SRPATLSSVPVESSLPPHVDVGDAEDRDEDEELADPEPTERGGLDGERAGVDDLDVEADEQDRRQVEADGEAALTAGGALGDARLERQHALLGAGRRATRGDERRRAHRCRGGWR